MPGFYTSDFYLYDPADPTKQLKFNTSALLTSQLVSITVPNITSGWTLAFKEKNNSFTVGQSIDGANAMAVTGGAGVPLTINADAAQSVDLLRVYNPSAALTFSLDNNAKVSLATLLTGGLLISSGGSDALAFDTSAMTATRTWTTTKYQGVPVISGDTAPASLASGKLGKVNLTGQAGDIASANLTFSPSTGVYVIDAILEDTASDITAGIVTVTFAWTDDAGATTDATLTQTLTATGRNRITIPLWLQSGNISYSTAHTGIFGTATYALRIRVTALG